MMKLSKHGLFHENDDEVVTPIVDGEVYAYLNDAVYIEEGVTLGDTLLLLNDNPYLKQIFPRFKMFDLEDIVDNTREIPEPDCGNITTLCISHVISHSSSDVSFKLDESPTKTLGFTEVNEPYSHSESYYDLVGLSDDDSDEETYSMSLTPLHKMLGLKIKPEIVSNLYISVKSKGEYETITYVDDNYHVSLYDLFNAIIEELTFHGSEEGKQEVIEDLDKAMEEINLLEQGDDDE